jgi:hypothetical protein
MGQDRNSFFLKRRNFYYIKTCDKFVYHSKCGKSRPAFVGTRAALALQKQQFHVIQVRKKTSIKKLSISGD